MKYMSKTPKAIATIFILMFLTSSYMLLKGHYEGHKFDVNKIPTKRTYDYGSTLRCVFERKDWSGLQISENFSNKYKNKYDITEHAGNFVSYGAGSVVENGEKLIIIDYLKESIFDFDDSKGVRYYLYFKYKTTDDGLLDDVEFVRMEKRNPMSGRLIEE